MEYNTEYTKQELVRIAKRENNSKRTYLVVNPLQGKHVPVSPLRVSELFAALSQKIQQAYDNERLLFVGFAETATAIGAAVALKVGGYVTQTTREGLEGVEYFYFSETHSHATEQRLVKEDLQRVMSKIDRIVFVEDEVTTGNTILHCIEQLQKEFGSNLLFSVASLLNGMNSAALKTYKDKGINIHYLVKTNHDNYGKMAQNYAGDGTYYTLDKVKKTPKDMSGVNITNVFNYCNGRRIHKADEYNKACEALWEQIKEKNLYNPDEDILVLGTEEFMYPALFVAQNIEKEGCRVHFHATTRSPIAVSTEAEYPLSQRFELISLYEETRTTYIYNLRKYDKVIIVTDAKVNDKGLDTLIAALKYKENNSIELVRWQ